MKQIVELSQKIRSCLETEDYGSLEELGEEFGTLLINNFGDEGLYSLNENEIKDFELCALVLEYTKLHYDELTNLYFIINEVCSTYTQLELLCTRVASLNIPNEIGHIQNDWKNSLKRFLEIFITMQDSSSQILSDVGHRTFLDRTGTKVIGHINKLLEQINMKEELISYLTDILLKDERFMEQVPRVLGFSTTKNESDIDKNLFNLDPLYRNHLE